MWRKLKKEMKMIKWPSKKVVKEDVLVVLATSSTIMVAISIINLISKNLLNLLF